MENKPAMAAGPVRIPIGDEIDLHTFRPEEVEDLLLDYFSECLKRRIDRVRVVHGKGTGALKRKVRAALKRNPLVAAFYDADPAGGGWGATLVDLKKPAKKGLMPFSAK